MSENSKKTMPKGGSKGGTRFPRINLQQAYDYSKKLVSKTHTSPQPENIILPGVFDNSGPIGRVRVSAMKQYNLIEGTPKAYTATELAKSIVAAPKEEVTLHLQKAFFFPKIFLNLYETFKGDKTTEAKIRQQAIKLDVHPDSSEECTKIFVESLLFIQLGTQNGEEIFVELTPKTGTIKNDKTNPDDVEKNKDDESGKDEDQNNDSSVANKSKINAQVNISVDPSMDPEKLEKLLKLLKQYGAL